MRKKFIQGCIAITAVVAFVLLPVAPPREAHAQSIAQLQAQIASLIQQVAELQARLNSLNGGSSGGQALVCRNIIFARNLGLGSSGSDVRDLQRILNSSVVPGIVVATAGAGSPGLETTYYGPLTASAVSRFQAQYAAQVLHPLGLTQPTGFFGASSRAQIARLCNQATPTPPTPPTQPDDELRGGAGNVNIDLLARPSNEDAGEGDEEVAVLGFEVEAEDSDVRLIRVEVQFEAVGTVRGDRPWDYFESVMILDEDNDVIAEEQAGDRDDWNETSNDVYEIDFTNLREIIRENQSKEFFIAVTIDDNLDSGDIPQDWRVTLEEDSLRVVDALGTTLFAPDSDLSRTFTVEEATAGDLELSLTDDFEDDLIVQIEEDDETDNVTILEFVAQTDERSVTIEELTVTLNADDESGNDAQITDIINTIHLYNGSTRLASESVTGTDTGSTEVTFEDVDFEIDEDSTETLSIRADINEQDGNFEVGSRVSVDIDGTDVVAEDDRGDDVDVTDTISGPWVYLFTDAPQIEIVSTSESTVGGSDTTGQFTIVFDVTAAGDDVFVGEDAGTSTGAGVGVVYDVLRGNTDVTGSVTTSATLTSSATRMGDTFRVRENQTRRFTLSVAVNNAGGTAGFYRVQLDQIGWATSDTTTLSYISTGLEEGETDPLFLDTTN